MFTNLAIEKKGLPFLTLPLRPMPDATSSRPEEEAEEEANEQKQRQVLHDDGSGRPVEGSAGGYPSLVVNLKWVIFW